MKSLIYYIAEIFLTIRIHIAFAWNVVIDEIRS